MSKGSLAATEDGGNSASSPKRARTRDGEDKPGADSGIIEYVEMTQFMCHKSLQLTLGPGINLITGPNGSGKSAVLAAITIALGGTTASTDRGSDLQSFIREGQNVAEVTVHIKNQGDLAYKPREYGRAIVIARRIPKDGSPSWKIEDVNGNIMSTERDEVAAICDHMNIQVDNPLNILTQDAAQRFLTALDPRELYKFFLEGSGLQRLSDEHELSMRDITRTNGLILEKKTLQRYLMAQVREITLRFQEATEAREQQRQVDKLKEELMWAHVASKQEELEQQSIQLSLLSRRIPKIEECIKRADEELEAATKGIEAWQSEFENMGGCCDNLKEAKRRLQAEMAAGKNEIRTVTDDLKQLDAQNKVLKETIAAMNPLISETEEHFPLVLAGLKQAKEAAATEMEDVLRLAEGLLSEKNELAIVRRRLLQQFNAINDQLEASENIKKENQRFIEAAVERRLGAAHQKQYYEKKLDDEHAKVAAAKHVATVLEEELSNSITKATELCERIPNPRKPADVKHQLDSIQNLLRRRDMCQGVSLEELARERDEARTALEEVEGEIRQLTALNEAAKQTLGKKIQRWHELRRHICLRCKHIFQHHYRRSGNLASIRFDHEARKLQLRVSTVDQSQTQKSVMAMRLLLSLWESIEGPIRYLDEFDVDMDPVDFQTSMNILLDGVNSYGQQYILITAQDMTDVTLGPSVRVHRMMDPGMGERMQGTCAS